MAEPKFAPSILSADFARLAEAVIAVERAGADWVHVDVMDGHFVPNLTFGPKMVADLRKATRLPLDVHLMIDRPEEWVDRYADAGATYLTIHIDATRDVLGTLAAIRGRGVLPGLALNPETAVAEAELRQTRVADSEVMRDLVHDRVAHDLGLASRRRRDPFDRPAEDADTVGEVGLLRAALGEWDSFVQTEERGPSRKLLWRGLIFDHDLEIADALAELRG